MPRPAPPSPQVQEAVAFLTAVWGEKLPGGLYAQLWELKAKRTAYLQHWAAVDSVLARSRHTDVYLQVSAVAKSLSASVRGKANQAAAIPGLWLDVDVNGGPDQREGYAPDQDAALAVVRAIAPPTLVLGTGYGVQAWWIFDEPWVFADAEDRERAADVAAQWVHAHRADAGFKLDAVGDLARVLRLPGTLNGKGGLAAPVSMIGAPGDRLPRAALCEEAAGRSHGLARAKLNGGASTGAELGDLPDVRDWPVEAIRAMREADDLFARNWTRNRKGRAADWSDSEYDMAIVGTCVRAGMAPDAAIAAAMQSRREFGAPEKAEKLERLDYWQRTLRAAGEVTPDETAASAKAQEAKLVSELRVMQEDTSPATIKAEAPSRWAKLNKLVGGGDGGLPRVVEWHQWGTDPQAATHVWLLSDGTEVPLPSMKTVLLSQGEVQAALATVSNVLSPRTWKNETWRMAIQAVLPLRQMHEAHEEQRDQRALQWVAQVLGNRGVESDPVHVESAIAERRPFQRDGRTYITTAHLGQQLRALRITEAKDTQLGPLLRSAGFDRSQVSFDRENGKRTSRSYWSIDTEQLP